MRILIAEDDPVSARILSKMLERYAEVTVTANGEQAFDAFENAVENGCPFDLIFLDIMMPEVIGHETLAAIREFEQMKGVITGEGARVVMVTALDDGSNIYEAHRNDCVDYINKPIKREIVVGLLERLGLITKSSS